VLYGKKPEVDILWSKMEGEDTLLTSVYCEEVVDCKEWPFGCAIWDDVDE
jgi:hypothetical protein